MAHSIQIRTQGIEKIGAFGIFAIAAVNIPVITEMLLWMIAVNICSENFSEADAQRIKEIESVTNHDVKAVEYFIKEEFDKLGGRAAGMPRVIKTGVR